MPTTPPLWHPPPAVSLPRRVLYSLSSALARATSFLKMAALVKPTESLKERIARLARVNRVLERQPSDVSNKHSMAARRKMAVVVETALGVQDIEKREQGIRRALSISTLPPPPKHYDLSPAITQGTPVKSKPRQRPEWAIEAQSSPPELSPQKLSVQSSAPPENSASGSSVSKSRFLTMERNEDQSGLGVQLVRKAPVLVRKAPVLHRCGNDGNAQNNNNTQASLNSSGNKGSSSNRLANNAVLGLQRRSHSAKDLHLAHQGQVDVSAELAKHFRMTRLSGPHTPLELPGGCVVCLRVECCTAVRPGRNGSLRGCSEAYVLHRNRLANLLRILCPDPSTIEATANGEPMMQNTSQHQSLTPSWRNAPTLQQDGSTVEGFEANVTKSLLPPRVGAFEVEILVRFRGASYGPVTAFSKIRSGRFPIHDKLAEMIRFCVSLLLGDNFPTEGEAADMLKPSSNPSVQSLPEANHTAEDMQNDKWEAMRVAALEALSTLYPLEVPTSHTLHVRIEYCIAQRPGRNGSLQGSAKTYALHMQHLVEHVRSMLPSAQVDVNVAEEINEKDQPGKPAKDQDAKSIHAAPPQASLTWQRPPPKLPPGPSRRGGAPAERFLLQDPSNLEQRPGQSKKRMSWEQYLPRTELIEWLPPKAERYGYRPPPPPPPRPFIPRIGAFEISVKLVGPSSHAVYGPVLVFSKLSSGTFPEHGKVLSRLHRLAHQLILKASRPGGSAFQPLCDTAIKRPVLSQAAAPAPAPALASRPTTSSEAGVPGRSPSIRPAVARSVSFYSD